MVSKNVQIKQKVEAFLREHFVMELATSYKDKPSVSPVVYIVDDDLQFYFVTYADSVKAQKLQKNPYCSFTIWESQQMSIQADGTAQVITDVQKIEWVMDAFADAATKDPHFWAPIFRIKKRSYQVFKITPTWMRSLDLSQSTVRQQKTPFTEIQV